MTYNAGERKDVRRAEKRAAVAEAQAGAVIRSLMSETAGRQWVLAKLEAAHIFSASFDRDPIQMAFNEGERNQGQLLLNDIMRYCPDQYMLMMRESNERHIAGERSGGTITDGGNKGRADTSADDGDGTAEAA